MITFDELQVGLKADLLHVPALMAMLRAIDERFPDESPLWETLTLSPWRTLHIDFDHVAGIASDTPSTQLLVALAHNLWNGDVQASPYEVLHRCDGSRVWWVMLALGSVAERGRGPATDEIRRRLGL